MHKEPAVRPLACMCMCMAAVSFSDWFIITCMHMVWHAVQGVAHWFQRTYIFVNIAPIISRSTILKIKTLRLRVYDEQCTTISKKNKEYRARVWIFEIKHSQDHMGCMHWVNISATMIRKWTKVADSFSDQRRKQHKLIGGLIFRTSFFSFLLLYHLPLSSIK